VTGAKNAYVFDLYGTLLDYGSLAQIFAPLVARPDVFVSDWRQKQVQYTFAAALMDRYVDFDTLTGRAFAYVCAAHGVEPDAAQRSLAVEAWSALPAYPDAVDTLRTLHARGERCAVLSNGTPRAIAAALEHAGVAPFLEASLSVDAARTYKPKAPVYELAVRHFAMRPDRIAFVSSNGWDATGAAEFGFRVTWCNRAGLPAETFGKGPERTIRSLAELLHD
jgi:2-haloacid dehalogenase